MEKYKVCLCGVNCPSKKDILEYCQVVDNDYYIAINNELVSINFGEYIEHSEYIKYDEFFDENFCKKNDCVTIDFENILKFNDFMVNKKLFTEMGLYEIECDCFKLIDNYLKYITKNNIINHVKYYLKNDYFNDMQWNHYLRKKIFEYSDVSTIRSCLKYIPIDDLFNYFLLSLSRNDNIILDYLVNKIRIYWTSYFTGKKYKGNMFKIIKKDKLVDIPNMYFILYEIIFYNKNYENVVEIYNREINRFQELLESQENINVKKNLINEHRKLKSKLMYDEKVKNSLLTDMLIRINGKPSVIIKQLLIDGANINTIIDRDFGHTLLHRSIEIIIKKKNLDLLDILFEMKLIDQSNLNLILEKSIGKIDLKNDTQLKIDENFIRELSGYGADIDECFDKLIKKAKKQNNNKLVDCLKNLKDDLI
ncbi:hypothetical protein QJ850_gp097 [Acanthamoeba polyphaga mimivirus]|uniref:Uncharacterized protein n=1 Tax=Acanthamoeba polyphaga mimivirus Kroon TaxID=3069720 RepID=A0A0G2Y9T2_9VIRU|nr:hypothetical protein QJ850_gp097 [Acanthamoeba polyphaga mimivirus]AKI80602.1 hypothetical protein [Acanthamoeba polyphaga mimivirus Kroon]